MTIARRLASLASTYAAALLLGFLLYVGLIRSPLLGGMTILFYRGVALAMVATLLMLLVLSAGRRWWRMPAETIIGATALALAFNITFLITFPVTFDRSVTIFLLSRIEARDGRMDRRALEEQFIRGYLGDLRQIDRRIAEQTLSGNICVRSDGRISLTPQGHELLGGARLVGGWFGADPRFVNAAPADGRAPDAH